ncbi:hypothetical protein RQP46_000332 [Phenoliferia psychrophenolica]
MSSATPSPVEEEPAVPRSSNPLTALSNLDSSKKYTLIFLASVGTTLLVTGASGGRLLKRAKRVTAAPSPAPAAAAPSATPFHAPPIPSTSAIPPVPIPAIPSLGRSKPLLKSWRHLSASPNSSSSPSYFLPNATLLSESNLLAQEIDAQDRLHKDGASQADQDAEEVVDDGFNPAVFAAKAFAIATAITVSSFGLAIGGVMAYYGVKDLESLSLALSHSLPGVFSSHRPALPAWALPPTKEASTPGDEEANEEHKEGVAYWVHVKETLDREAEEMKLERRRAWEKLRAKAGLGEAAPPPPPATAVSPGTG